MAYPRDVSSYKDGDRLDAATMNKPILQLAQRTEYLNGRIKELASNKSFASVRLPDAEVESGVGDDSVQNFDCVYLDPVTGLFKKALANVVVESNPFCISNPSAFAVGIAIDVATSGGDANSVATIVMSGLIEFVSSDQIQGMLEPGEQFKAGPYYLSSVVPGKITANPKGPSIYIGSFVASDEPNVSDPDDATAKYGVYAILAPQYKDLAEMHFHRAFALGTNHQDGIPAKKITTSNGEAVVTDASSLLLFVTGTSAGLEEEAYVLDVVKRLDTGSDVPSSGVYTIQNNVYTTTVTSSDQWSDLYVHWYNVYNNTHGVSKLLFVSGVLQPFAIGSCGLLGKFATKDGANNILFGVDGITPAHYRFGPNELEDNISTTPVFTTETIKGWRVLTKTEKDIVAENATISVPEAEEGDPIIGTITLSDSKFKNGDLVTVFGTTVSESAVVQDNEIVLENTEFSDGESVSIVAPKDVWFFTCDYVYEVGVDSGLNKFFPPTPVSGCSLLYNGVEMPNYTLFGDNAVYKVENTRILWNSKNAGGLKPFNQPTDYSNVALTFYTVKGKLPSSSFVTSIKAAEGSGIKIREEGTSNPASTGNLVIDAQIPVGTKDTGLSGYRVPKKVVGNRLLFGPVVSSLKAGAGLTLSNVEGQTEGCGDMTISLDSGFAGGMFDDIVLHNAKQELVGPFPYVKLLSSTSVPSAFTMKMHIPVMSANSVNGYKLLFCMSAFGLENASSKALYAAFVSLQANILQDWYPGMDREEHPAPSKTLLNDLVTVYGRADDASEGITPIKFGSADYKYQAFDPVIVHNGWSSDLEDDETSSNTRTRVYLEIPNLRPNASVAITVKRASKSQASSEFNEYTGEIGFMNMTWKLVEQTTQS